MINKNIVMLLILNVISVKIYAQQCISPACLEAKQLTLML
jgi:hypothetical protein